VIVRVVVDCESSMLSALYLGFENSDVMVCSL
jgi:hypothetical protein